MSGELPALHDAAEAWRDAAAAEHRSRLAVGMAALAASAAGVGWRDAAEVAGVEVTRLRRWAAEAQQEA